LALFLGATAAILQNRTIAVPVQRLSAVVETLAREGALSRVSLAGLGTAVHRDEAVVDEVGQLGQSFRRLVQMMSSLAQHAQAIALGNLSQAIEHKGELPDAFNRVKHTLTR